MKRLPVSPSTAVSADFSPDRVHRYTLRRTWDTSRAALAVIGLNPSTADETQDDPTVRRCIGFARDLDFGGLVMLNLFAFRSTDPAGLLSAADPVGPENDEHLQREACNAGLVVAAWGADPAAHKSGLQLRPGHDGRAGEVRRLLREDVTLFALRLTKAGHPGHPLYLPASCRPVALPEPS